MSIQRHKYQSGMTLLEVLVATAILAIIAGMAFMSLDGLARSKQSLDEQTRTLNQANLTQFMLQNDLQMAITSNQPLQAPERPEFVGSSQSFSLLRYRSNTVVSGRESRDRAGRNGYQDLPLIRVRWYIRNNQWIRAHQSAFSPPNSNQWVERPMLAVKSLNCQYRNKAGLVQSTWPNNQLEQAQLPEMISCDLQTQDNHRSVIKLVPWQQLGFL